MNVLKCKGNCNNCATSKLIDTTNKEQKEKIRQLNIDNQRRIDFLNLGYKRYYDKLTKVCENA